jgi:gamma-glutamylputrescine oxidase
MTISFWLDKNEEKATEKYDVVIVGAGVAGAAAAYWLSRRKNLNVLLLDSGTVGGGASGRNGGFILRGIFAYYNKAVQAYGRDTAQWIFRFNEETQSHLRELITRYGNAFSYIQSGSYLLASSLEELQDLEQSAELMKEDGFDVEYVKEDPLDRGFYGAIFNRNDAGVNPHLLVKSLAGISAFPVYENDEVYKIEPNSDGSILHTQNRLIHARTVLLATNAYLPLLLPEFRNIIQPVRGQIIVTRPLKEVVLERLCYANYGYEYFRQLSDGRFLLGGCREPFAKDEVGYDDILTADVQNSLHHYLKDRFPEVAGASIDYRWSGTMCFTQDGLPIIGELKDKPRVYYLAGCNGHGLGYSLALSKLFIEFVFDGASPGIFDAKRPSLEKSRT